MAHQSNYSSVSSKSDGHRRRKRKKGASKLQEKMDAWQADKEARDKRHQHSVNDWRVRPEDIGRIDKEQVEDVLQTTTTYQKPETQRDVGKIKNVSQHEKAALEYEEQLKKENFERMKREEKIEQSMKEQVTKIIGTSEWDKSKVQQWIDGILEAAGLILDKYLKDGVYKYAIDVHILKSTAIARQSDTLKSSTDYSIHLKVKNGRGLIAVVNTHAFRVN